MNKHKTYPRVFLEDVVKKEKYSIVDGPFGSNLKTSDYVEEGVPVLQGKNITNDNFILSELRYIKMKKAQELIRSKVVLGDILFVKIGSIGYSAEVTNLDKFEFAIIPANLAKVSIDEKIINKSFLLHWLRGNEVKNYLKKVASKTAQPALSLTKIKKIPIPLPPLEEQKKIAKLLDSTASTLEKINNSINKIDDLSVSLFHEMFKSSKKDNNNFELAKLNDVCDLITDGTHISPKYTERGIPMLDGKHIKDNFYIDIDLAEKFISEDTDRTLSKRCKPKVDDILISSRGSIGKIAIVQKNQNFNIMGNMILIRLGRKINKIYFIHYLKNIFKELNRMAQGVAQKGLYLNQIRNLEILVPNQKQQIKFSKIINNINMLREKKIKFKKNFESLIYSLRNEKYL